MFSKLFQGYPGWVAPSVAVALALVAAYVLAEIVARLVRSFLLKTTGKGRVLRSGAEHG